MECESSFWSNIIIENIYFVASSLQVIIVAIGLLTLFYQVKCRKADEAKARFEITYALCKEFTEKLHPESIEIRKSNKTTESTHKAVLLLNSLEAWSLPFNENYADKNYGQKYLGAVFTSTITDLFELISDVPTGESGYSNISKLKQSWE